MKRNEIIMFLIGFLSASFIFIFLYGSSFEYPFVTGNVVSNLNMTSPANFLDEKDILIFEDMVILKVKGASLSNYAGTGSMEPLINSKTNGIRIVPESEEDVAVGDIVSYLYEDKLIVHRVIEKSKDEEGIYFITKGDNSEFYDDKIRFEDIKYKTIGVIW